MASRSERDIPAYEEIDHTADLALRVAGSDLQDLFVHAAQGMFHLMRCPERDSASSSSQRETIVLDAPDRETLLVDWLGELLYLSERNHTCYHSFDIESLASTHLEALVGGTGGRPDRSIKAVTFSDLSIREREDGGYETVITFDV